MNILADPLEGAAATYYRQYYELVRAGQGCTEAEVGRPRERPQSGRTLSFDAAGSAASLGNQCTAADGDPTSAA